MSALAGLAELKLSGRREFVLGGGLVVLLAYFLYFHVYAPTAVEIAEIEAYVGSQDARLGSMESDSRVLSDLKKEIALLESQIKRHAKKLPTQERLEEVVSHIYQTGDESGLNVERLTQSGSWEKDADYVSIPLQIDYSGTYVGLVGFLTRLENSRTRIFVVDNIVVTSDAEAGAGLKGRIDIRTYYRG